MRVEFFAADDIQALADGKVMLMGLYPDKIFILSVPPEAPQGAQMMVPTLAVLASIIEAPTGDYEIRPELLLPDESPYPMDLGVKRVHIHSGKSVNAVFKFAPFVFTSFGVFTFRIHIADQVFEAKIEMRRNIQN